MEVAEAASVLRSTALAKTSHRPCCEIARAPRLGRGQLVVTHVVGGVVVRRQHSDRAVTQVGDMEPVGGHRRSGGIVDEHLRRPSGQVEADHERCGQFDPGCHSEIDARGLVHHVGGIVRDRRRSGVGGSRLARRVRRQQFGLPCRRSPCVDVAGCRCEGFGSRSGDEDDRFPIGGDVDRSRGDHRGHRRRRHVERVGANEGIRGVGTLVSTDLAAGRPHDRRPIERQRRRADPAHAPSSSAGRSPASPADGSALDGRVRLDAVGRLGIGAVGRAVPRSSESRPDAVGRGRLVVVGGLRTGVVGRVRSRRARPSPPREAGSCRSRRRSEADRQRRRRTDRPPRVLRSPRRRRARSRRPDTRSH